jgi:hypothetical protein
MGFSRKSPAPVLDANEATRTFLKSCVGRSGAALISINFLEVPANRQGYLAHTVSTVEPIVLRDSRSRCACAASFSG